MSRATPAVPRALATLPLRTLRPRDAASTYAQPRAEMRRLEERGALHRVAHGFYVVVPQESAGTAWMPTLEAAAAGIAAAEFGPARAVLMSVSAARLHGAIPRAVATAVVAVPMQRNAISLIDRQATVRFVKRNTDRLDAERMATELGPALVTTPEQTVLDLARRPTLGGSEAESREAVQALLPRCDTELLEELAAAQRARASLARAHGWMDQ